MLLNGLPFCWNLSIKSPCFTSNFLCDNEQFERQWRRNIYILLRQIGSNLLYLITGVIIPSLEPKLNSERYYYVKLHSSLCLWARKFPHEVEGETLDGLNSNYFELDKRTDGQVVLPTSRYSELIATALKPSPALSISGSQRAPSH